MRQHWKLFMFDILSSIRRSSKYQLKKKRRRMKKFNKGQTDSLTLKQRDRSMYGYIITTIQSNIFLDFWCAIKTWRGLENYFLQSNQILHVTSQWIFQTTTADMGHYVWGRVIFVFQPSSFDEILRNIIRNNRELEGMMKNIFKFSKENLKKKGNFFSCFLFTSESTRFSGTSWLS